MSERELTDAEFWELQYRQVLSDNHALQEKAHSLSEQLVKVQQEVLRLAKTERKEETRQFFARLGLADNDAVVIDRDGKKLIVIQDETSNDNPES